MFALIYMFSILGIMRRKFYLVKLLLEVSSLNTFYQVIPHFMNFCTITLFFNLIKTILLINKYNINYM